jgi:hypothetical protein
MNSAFPLFPFHHPGMVQIDEVQRVFFCICILSGENPETV